MAICKYCKGEMLAVDKCRANAGIKALDEQGRERTYAPLPHLHAPRCGDCNVVRTGKHHPGCDMERCGHCGNQLISCPNVTALLILEPTKAKKG